MGAPWGWCSGTGWRRSGRRTGAEGTADERLARLLARDERGQQAYGRGAQLRPGDVESGRYGLARQIGGGLPSRARGHLGRAVEARLTHGGEIASLASIGAVPLMSSYCASKAGAEAFAHALQTEVAHRGVAVGIADLNWTDTDMIRDSDQYAALRELRAHMPPPVRRVHDVETVAARLVRGLERRRTAVYAPA